ncbi:MAG: phasin family protein [Snowella sp.]|nr:phasin family protein [Snowella sp.]
MRDLVQKAFYLGLGLASYAAEKATSNLQELRVQAQKLADEMVERGEMTAEEARRYVDDLINQAQVMPETSPEEKSPRPPRRIEIVFDDAEDTAPDNTPAGSTTVNNPNTVEDLRKQVEALQEELRRIRRN